MPTVSLNITTGLEYSPTDLVDSSVKLHNFIVGQDGSLYKIPALKNLKTLVVPAYGNTVSNTDPDFLPERLMDVKKFQTFQIYEDKKTTTNFDIKTAKSFRRLCFLGIYFHGSINVDYNGDLYADDASLEPYLRTFATKSYQHDPDNPPNRLDLNTYSGKIVFDFNSQYDEDTEKERKPEDVASAVFPCQYMFEPLETGFKALKTVRNMVFARIAADEANPVQSLKIKDEKNKRYEINDLAKGALIIGSRMIFYSDRQNAILVSEPNNFTTLKEDQSNVDKIYKIIPPEQIQSITDFNGNIITFTPSGMERWLISSDEESILQRDPTFHFDFRTRYNGSFVRANKDLYFYTDDFRAYRLNADLSVENIFEGKLPLTKPLDSFLLSPDYQEKDYPCSHFKMLGQKFVSFGPWLYNIDTQTWSTYNFDGWKTPTDDPVKNGKEWTWADDTSKQVVSTAYDDIVCTYNSITRPLSYQEMQEATFDDISPSLIEGKHQWGEVAYFTSRMYQDERTFSLDGIEIYVRGGMLEQGVSKMWLKVLLGGEKGDFDINDSTTWGKEATYQVLPSSKLGEPEVTHVGKFVWRTNIKTDRFRVQVVTNERRGIVVQSVLANITQISDSQDYLVNRSNPQQQTQK